MKTSKLFFAMAAMAATVCFSSCDNEDEIVDNGTAVKFSSGIAAPQTRVATDGDGNSTWNTGDAIGIYMVENGTTTVVENAANMKYTAASTGASTTFNAAPTAIYYPIDVTTKVSFIAYHPHAAVSNFVYPVNVATQTSQTNIDLMYATANNSGNGYDKTNTAAVNFTFGHQLVKLILTVTKGAGVTGDVTAVAINGMNTTASFDLKGAGGLTDAGTPDPITPYAAMAGSKYEAILLPAAVIGAMHTVTFTCDNGETYTWKMSDELASLDAGNIYTYDITLTKYAVTATGTITPWISGNTGTGIAE